MGGHRIAGSKTDADWEQFRDRLIKDGTKELWREAFKQFFVARIHLRYLAPMKTLRKKGKREGEGFAVMAIACSLIEFLGATREGKQYRHIEDDSEPGPNEYSSSSKMFADFLAKQKPFSTAFTSRTIAMKFYENVRCGLLHEARTKDGWRIKARSPSGAIIDRGSKIVFRDNFVLAIRRYIASYGKELKDKKELQEAFISRFDSLCK